MLRRSKERYRWHLKVTKKVNVNGKWADYVVVESDVHPIFGEASHSLKKASGEAYFDDKLEVELKFINEDYDFIVGSVINPRPLNIKYVLELYYDEVLRKTTYFRKSTCEIDENHHILKVDLKEIGVYDRIEDKKADEVNVAKLGLEKHDVMHRIRPMMQVYRLGKEEVFYINSEYILNSSQCYSILDLNKLHVDDNMTVILALTAQLYNANGVLVGTYYGTNKVNFTGNIETFRFYKDRIVGNDYIDIEYNPNAVTTYSDGWAFRRNGLYDIRRALVTLANTHEFLWQERRAGGTHYTIKYTLNVFGYNMLYASSSIRRYSNDFIDSGLYSDAIPNVTLNPIKVVSRGSTIPPEYAAVYEEEWMDGFCTYVDTGAMMKKMYSATTSYYEQYTYWTTVRDYMLLQDLVKAMLEKVDADLVYEDNVQHSEFFSSAVNPVSGELNGIYYVTPKSNVLSVDYDYAAWKAMLTFEQLMSMIRNVFNCYYDVYEDGEGVRHFRIEHAVWYANGGSYNDARRGEIDLTAYKDGRNGLPLAYRTKRWGYDTSGMPTKIEFSWMDDASEAFGGVPIEVPENRMLINTNYTEKKEITAFSADLGYLSIAEGAVSMDGFVIIHTDETGNIDFGTVELDEVSYTVENYKLSMVYLHDRFWKYGLCGTHAMINNKEYAISNPPRMRKAEVEFVLPKGAEYNQYSLLRTECGYGHIEDIALDLNSGKVTATVKYELETTREADDVIISNEIGDTTAADIIDYINSHTDVTDEMLTNRFGTGTENAMINLIKSKLVKKKTNGTYVSLDVATRAEVEKEVLPTWSEGELLQYILDNQFEKKEAVESQCENGKEALQELMNEGSAVLLGDMTVIAPDVTDDALRYMQDFIGVGVMERIEVVDKIGSVQTAYYLCCNQIMEQEKGLYASYMDWFDMNAIFAFIEEERNTDALLVDATGREEVRNYMMYLTKLGFVEKDGEIYIITKQE